MRDRGYPVDDFEQRAADISVDHPQVVDDYRAAHVPMLPAVVAGVAADVDRLLREADRRPEEH